MTLTIEDGSGVETADSYVDVEAADQYIQDWHESSDWSDLDETGKERALRHAARYIDAFRFAGWPTYQKQRRAFPRIGIPKEGAPAHVPDDSSPGLTGSHGGPVPHWYWPSDEIPDQVKEAQIEAALRHAQGDDLLPDHDGGTIAAQTQEAGPVRQQTQYSSPRRQVKTREAVRALLQPFLSSSRGSGSLSRSIA